MNFTKHLKWIIPLIVVLFIGVWVKNTYNTLAVAKKANDAAWGQVQVILQSRADKAVQMVSVIKGSSALEKTTLENITAARSGLTAATTRDGQVAAAQQLENVVNQFRIQVEAYPQIQTTQQFRDFNVVIEGTENRLAVERKRYNDSIFIYNAVVVQFPSMLVAKIFGFPAEPQFAAAATAQTAPVINFQ